MLSFAHDLHMTAGGPWMSRSMLQAACALVACAQSHCAGQPARSMHASGLQKSCAHLNTVPSEPITGGVTCRCCCSEVA